MMYFLTDENYYHTSIEINFPDDQLSYLKEDVCNVHPILKLEMLAKYFNYN